MIAQVGQLPKLMILAEEVVHVIELLIERTFLMTSVRTSFEIMIC